MRHGVLLVLVVGCSGQGEPARVSLAPSLLFPRGLLDSVTKVTVKVYDPAAGLDCDASTGKLTQSANPITTKELGTSLPSGPCPSGGKFCGDLTIAKSDKERLFQAQAGTPATDDFADGCTKAVMNQDALPLKIVMIRNVPPAVCGNRKIEPTEQCDPPDGVTCDDACHTKELTLSTGGAPSEKTAPFFLWPPGSGDGGRLLAFFSDGTKAGVSKGEISMRVMSDAFAPLAQFPSSTYLPNDPVQVPAQPQPGKKQLPAAAVVGTQYFVVFDDDSAGTSDIHLRSMDSSLTAQQSFNTPIGINGPTGCQDLNGEIGTQTFPSIAAGPNGALFIAWQDDAAQKIAGRTFSGGTCGPQQDISSGSANRNVKVAATATGWIAVWEGSADIKMRSIDSSGKPFGSETIVNENTAGLQDHPAIATLADGRFAVAWSDHQTANGTDIVMQRFTATASKVAGDQGAPANTTVAGDQLTPAVAAMNALGGSFVLVWLDVPTTHIRGRLAGGSSGFLFNNVDGQSGDFQVSIPDGRTRANPTVAVGGAGPAIGIGWQDGAAGIVGRRFPVPTQ